MIVVLPAGIWPFGCRADVRPGFFNTEDERGKRRATEQTSASPGEVPRAILGRKHLEIQQQAGWRPLIRR
jgi:hypothetical protein